METRFRARPKRRTTSKGADLRLVVLLPTIFAVDFVLARSGPAGINPAVLVRPLVVAMVVAVLAQVVVTVITRHRTSGAVATVLLLAGVVEPLLGTLLLLLVLGPPAVARLRRRPVYPINWNGVASALTPIAFIALAVSGTPLVGRVLDLPKASTPSSSVAETSPLPDIYVILLDEHGRSDTLAAMGFGIDPFLDEMEALGFEVAPDSHSNYNATILTLASMFNAQHIDSLVGDDPPDVVDAPFLQGILNRGVTLRWLADAGYETTAIASGVVSDDLFAVDHRLDLGEVNTFDASLLRAGFLRLLAPGEQAEWLFEQQRARLLATFEAVKAFAATDAGGPRFLFAHVMAPHDPIVFRADGSSAPPPGCLPTSCRLWDGVGKSDAEALAGQTAYVDHLMLDAARTILGSSDRPPVIVVLSDHGIRGNDDLDEQLRNLFLAFTPQRPGLFPTDVTPINLVPRLLNAYAGTTYPHASEESYRADLDLVLSRGYLPLTPWPQT